MGQRLYLERPQKFLAFLRLEAGKTDCHNVFVIYDLNDINRDYLLVHLN